MRASRLVVIAVTLVGLLLSSTGASLPRTTEAPGGLEFVPLIAVAPDDPPTTVADSYACTSPSPVVHYRYVHCYTPADIFAAYTVDQLHQEGLDGSGQTIVIVDSYGSPTALADLQTFSTAFGLPAPDLTIVYPNGSPPFNNAVNGSPAGWAFETSLDLQWAHAIAPKAKLVLIATNPAETEGVQGFPSMFKGIQWAIAHYPGAVISQSFAATEQSFQLAAPVQVARFHEVYQQAKEAGITVIGSSGDSGTANVDKQGRVYPYPTVNWPSSDPLVTSAGGTWLQYHWKWSPTLSTSQFYSCLGSSPPATCYSQYLASVPDSGQTEAVWKEDWLPAATGGGTSVLFDRPAFQDRVQRIVGPHRGLPDLSWNAAVDGGVLVYTSFPGVRVGWHVVGGTSAAAPQLAGLVALANQLRAQNHLGPVGYLNPRLYELSASDFTDIVRQPFGPGGIVTLADNAEYGSVVPGWPTTSGWDLTTGFGSPKADAFVHALAAPP